MTNTKCEPMVLKQLIIELISIYVNVIPFEGKNISI
jgi:hypothetical protein